MSPPYKFVDEATGLVVETNGTKWQGIDAPVGNPIEIFNTSGSWARISPGTLIRPPDGTDIPPDPVPIPPDPTPVPPDPTPVPPEATDMDYPKTESELRAVLQSYADNHYVGLLDPRTKVTVANEIVIRQASNDGAPWGVNGNYARLTFTGAGQDLLRYEGVNGVNNRCLTIKNLVLDGGDVGNMSGGKAKACLHVYAPLGDDGPIYKFHLENIITSGAVNGVFLQGGVYEGLMQNIHAENCTGDGLRLEHTFIAGNKNGIISNVLMIHPNSSRNFGAGIRTVYSVGILGGSYILNGGGGVVAPDGLRWALMNNGENTGGAEQAVFVVPSNGYGSNIAMCEASGDGTTRCRRWTGTQWVDVGKPLIYNIAMNAAVATSGLTHGYYGPAPDPMKPIKTI